MKKILRTLPAALFAALAAAQYTYLPIPQGRLNATASSSYSGAPPGNAINLTVGAGLDANGLLGTAYTTMWVNGGGGEANTWFRVNLGQDTLLAAIKLWNYNQDGAGYSNRGIRLVDIYTAPEGASGAVAGSPPLFDEPGGWAHLTSHEFPRAVNEPNGSCGPGPLLELPPVMARWVAFHVKSNWGGDLTGIGKIQFFELEVPPFEVKGAVPGMPKDAADPAFGLHFNIAPGSNFTASVAAAWTNDAQTTFAYAAGRETLEYEGIGVFTNTAAFQPGNSFHYTLPKTPAQIVWHFAITNRLDASAGPDGDVSENTAWCGSTNTHRFTAVADPGFMFYRWTGDAPVSPVDLRYENPLDLPGDQPRAVRAEFIPSAGGEVRYVATDGDDARDGLTPGTAMKSINAAVADLDSLGTSVTGLVLVAAGKYGLTQTIALNNAITVRGMTGRPLDVELDRLNDSFTLRLLRMNHPGARIENISMRNGQLNWENTGGDNFRIDALGGTASNCVSHSMVSVSWGGGGAYVDSPDALVTHCVFSNIVSRNDAGALYGAVWLVRGRLEHSLIARNASAINAGPGAVSAGGLYMTGGAVTNCTISGNTSRNCGGVYATAGSVANTVIAGNASTLDGGNRAAWGGTAGVFHNCYTDSADPINPDCFARPTPVLLNDAQAGDYYPAAGSPLIDGGVPLANPPALDLAGNPRVQGNGIDVGCYESNPARVAASFDCGPREGFAPARVEFFATLSGTNGSEEVGFAWDFGDGTVDPLQGADAAHTYGGGTFAPVLTVLTNGAFAATKTYGNLLQFSPRVLYVDAARAGQPLSPPYDDPGFLNAAPDVQTAVNYAVNGCEIVIREGDYPIASQVSIQKRLRVRGETGNPGDVVLRRQSGDTRVMVVNHPDAWVEGVALQDGLNMNGANLYMDVRGGTVSNCVLRGGYAEWNTGSAAYLNSASALLTHCVVTNNEAVSGRGYSIIRLYAGNIENCLVADNRLRNPERNSTAVVGLSAGNVRNCTFTRNQVAARGTGGETVGGGIFTYIHGNGFVENCVVAGNINAVNGSAGPLWEVGLWGNPGFNRVTNCTVDIEDPNPSAPVHVHPSNNYGAAEDVFKNYAEGDYRLKTGSPAVNVGPRVTEGEAATAGVDLDGNPRIFGLRQDNGCYELQHAPGTLLLVK